ncbi:universal stress protein [Actinoplanes palleronii]|uniref:universal stress protein n=1 Tax=Actinoplanes palleronii TaxID=113570 RepID=UPI001943A7CC|nr:universal stress protein [Actinoplanes palleronii]
MRTSPARPSRSPQPGGRIVAGLIGAVPAETVLRYAFGEAERYGAAVTVVATGPASTADDRFVRDVARRWADKYPAVDATVTVRRSVDAVITLAAASRQADLLVVAAGTDPRSAAMVAALARLAHSAVRIVDGVSDRRCPVGPGGR